MTNNRPIVIIGAPRSGTNLLRDMLVKLSGVGTWPCDEINYIWRHGNIRFPSDEFSPDMATQKIKAYINKKFVALARSMKLDTVVEKTCANSLRVGFVSEVLPDAKYIFIVRDGMDVVGSAMKRWTAPLDIPYLFRKSRFVPVFDLPYYASRYLFHRVYRLTSNKRRLSLWGPSMSDIEDLLSRYTLSEVCALQWKACVEKAEAGLSSIPSDRIVKVKYEDFVNNPVEEFSRLSSFVGGNLTGSIKSQLVDSVSNSSIGKGRISLGLGGVERLRPLIESTLERHNYE